MPLCFLQNVVFFCHYQPITTTTTTTTISNKIDIENNKIINLLSLEVTFRVT
jgi:hypothetical protein